MELVTMHTHTNYTGHGHGTVAELVNAAAAAGITAIAVTEHYPMSEAMDPTNEVSMPQERMPQYLIDIAAAAAAHPAMDVLPGCEVDWLGAQEDRDFSALDFSNFVHVLGSVHYLDGWAFDDPAQEARWHDVGVDAVWRRYFEVWCEAASCREAPFTCMAHPDLVKKFGYRPSFNPQPLYDQAAEAVAAGGRMVEVNTSGLTYACAELFPAPDLLCTFYRAGIPCTIGTDAHDPAVVARNLMPGLRAMYEAGYRCVTVPTKSGDRREIVLE